MSEQLQCCYHNRIQCPHQMPSELGIGRIFDVSCAGFALECYSFSNHLLLIDFHNTVTECGGNFLESLLVRLPAR